MSVRSFRRRATSVTVPGIPKRTLFSGGTKDSGYTYTLG